MGLVYTLVVGLPLCFFLVTIGLIYCATIVGGASTSPTHMTSEPPSSWRRATFIGVARPR
jgi:hypothetical protein